MVAIAFTRKNPNPDARRELLRLALGVLGVWIALLPAAAAADEAISGTASVFRDLEEGERRPKARWQVLKSDNYRILHMNPALARRVAEIAERERDVLWRAWTGKEPPDRWPEPCEILLYPSYHEMIVMTGGEPKAGSTLVRPSQLYHGRILSRKVNLTADDDGLLDATVPHEVSHLVFGDLFGGKLPLWVNEGAATMAEGEAKQRYYQRVLQRFRAERRIFDTAELVEMQRYPDFPFGSLFYAQSSALVAYLLSLGDGPTFVAFVGRLSKAGLGRHAYAWALRQTYGIGSLTELHRRWLRFVAEP